MKKFFFFAFIPLTSYASFSDVALDHPHQEAITYLESQNVINGYEDGTFKPQALINRAEFLKIILESRMPSNLDCRQERSFSDVPKDAWYTTYLNQAVCENIISGYEDGTFRAGNPILFTEAAKILTQSFQIPVDQAEPWYAPHTNALGNLNAIPTSINTFSQPITRGEMAEMVFRIRTDNQLKPANQLSINIEPEIIIQPRNSEFDDGQISDESLLELINKARSELEAPTVLIDKTLDSIAQNYASRMNEENFFDHLDPEGNSPAQRATAGGYLYQAIGENIAKGQKSTSEVFETWKSSPGHWANIINPLYTEIGIGRVKETNDPRFSGYVWVLILGTK